MNQTRLSLISKKVGWSEPASQLPWPSFREVKDAIRDCNISDEAASKLLTWHRFLPVAETDNQRELIKLIFEVGMQKLK